ncbi:hypothetical protein SAMN02745248_02164 [Hathewaya proteolytica DSM 3090]|uniref:Uncharacterized protein n=1 Tax=Hathewaya proteolytica DSM 3090 TaxID=1121331 RepID=A0A1M6QZA8_9CLOT|nr:hypothetical protein [Hathewaya proteolytica]SHK25407.1 hypothetical protein SAMN02745248_02164 [Hathewaya proteolytica DSM 3090]
MNNRNKNVLIISAIVCTILGGFTFAISYNNSNNSNNSNNKVVSKKHDVVLSDSTILSGEIDKKDHDKEALAMLQGRIVNVMNNAIIGDCKKSTAKDSEQFLQQIPFRQDFDFVTYESNCRENGVDKPIRYAIGICNKKESPLKGMFCDYDFAKTEKDGAVENTILCKHENNDRKEVYKLKGMDRCATLCGGNIAVVLQCNQNERIYLPFQRLNYGNMQISYLEDTIKRNVKVMPPVNEDYIKVSKLDITNDVFGSSEYIVLNQEEKQKIQEEFKKNQPIRNKAASTAIFHTVTFSMDNKEYECENGFPGQYFMNLIKTRCNFDDYNIEDLKNIKKASLQKYNINSTQNYDLDEKTVIFKEETVSDSQQLKIILDALKSTSNEEGINSVPDDYNVRILTLTRDDGMEIKIKLSKLSSEHKEAAVIMENGYWYKISQNNLQKVYDSFGK